MMERVGVVPVGSGADPLSHREMQILRMRAAGMTNGRIAHLLGLSEQTVKNTQVRIYDKLGVDNLLAAMWVQGWVKLS